jgi:hypothetical protein
MFVTRMGGPARSRTVFLRRMSALALAFTFCWYGVCSAPSASTRQIRWTRLTKPLLPVKRS